MVERLKRFLGFTRSAFFSLAIHSLIVAFLVADLWWPFSRNPEPIQRAPTIEAAAVSLEEIQEIKNRQALIKEQEEQRFREIEEQRQREAEAERLAIEQEQQRIQEAERQRAEQEEARKLAEQAEQERLAEERKKAEEAERKIKEEEARKIAEEERKRKQEEERKRKEEAEKKRKEEEEARKKAEEEERKRKEEEERKKAEEERKRKDEAEKKRLEEESKRAEEEKLLKELEEEALRSQAIRSLSSLRDLIAEDIEDNWRRPSQEIQGLQATIKVRVSINGEVISAEVIKSSGDLKFDRSAEVAIDKASPLPFPSNPKYYDYIKEFNLLFNPDG
ncbi:MAG: cell envelope integrity protein TolA [Gammaproteobacteria bacterium]|nr:cell envelope integrity protein TolA [Gammaproteobacteria bacterium]